jgi:hypothetical protein
MLKYVLVALLFPYFSKIYAAEVAEEVVEIPRKLVVPADGFNFEASARLQELLKKSEPAHICACIQARNVCALVYPFVPIQHIFFWHLAPDSPSVITSFIPSLKAGCPQYLSVIEAELQSLPTFFTRAAFNQINDGYLEGDVPVHEKWGNAAITCFNISEVLTPIQNEHMRFEIASHLMLFMQYRSTHLLTYYAKALADDFANLENNYYPLYCLTRRLKGHDELQTALLEKLKLYGESSSGPSVIFSFARKILRTIQNKGYVKETAVAFISRMIASDTPSTELLALRD